MSKVFAVIRREFVERVRTKAFVIGTLLGPLFFIGMAVLPALLLSRETTGRKVVVIDAGTGEFGGKVTAALAAAKKGSVRRRRPSLCRRSSWPGPGLKKCETRWFGSPVFPSDWTGRSMGS